MSSTKRSRTAVAFAMLFALEVGFTVGHGGIGTAAPNERDLVVSRTLTKASAGQLTGNRLTLYGTGSWNTSTGDIDARGTFVHRHQDGSLFAQGEWVVTGVESFHGYGFTGDLGGGKLVLSVDLVVGGETEVHVDDFTVTSTFGHPPSGAVQGVTIPSLGFTQPVQAAHRFTAFLLV